MITWYRYDFHTDMSSTRFLLWPCFSLHDTGTKFHTSNCIGTTWSRTGMLRTHQATSRGTYFCQRDMSHELKSSWIHATCRGDKILAPRQDFACIRVAESCRSEKITTSAHMKMKQKQDPPTSPCYTTPRVYLDVYIVGARISEDFVSRTWIQLVQLYGTCSWDKIFRNSCSNDVSI